MKHFLMTLLVLFAFSSLVSAQFVFDPFEEHPETNYNVQYVSVNDTSRVLVELESANVQVGSHAMSLDWRAQAAESWGGFAKIELFPPDSAGLWDFSAFDSISFWYNNIEASTTPGRVHFRLQLFDASNAPDTTTDGGETELWYSFEYILDDTPGWTKIKMPLADVGSAAQTGSNGFWRTGWSGITGNDTLNLDKIRGLGLEFSTAAPQDFAVDSGRVIIDHLALEGASKLDLVFWTGKKYGAGFSPFQWNGSVGPEADMGYTPGTPALKWVQDPGQAWAGFGWNFNDPKYMLFRWPLDSLKFKMKAPSGTGTLRAQFEAGADKVGINFDPIDDGEWHQYSLALADFVFFDGSTSFDTTAVTVFQFLTEGTGNGATIYWDDIWTGDPYIDNINPERPTGVSAIADNQNYFNLVTWLDVPGEDLESYTVLASPNPIPDDLSDPMIEYIAVNVAEGTQNAVHYLQYPLTDQSVTYYYAVICTDNFGNQGLPGTSASSTSNTAKGIPTISLDVPATFAADGDLTEWYDSGIMPWELKPSENNTATGAFDNDDDLTAIVFVAVDQDFLYIAGDIIDNVYNYGTGNWWDQDALQFFIGLYDWRGPKHQAYEAGSEPDYSIVVKEDEVLREAGGKQLLAPADAGYYFEGYNPDWVFEAQIPLDSLKGDNDDRFYAQRGMRIAMDIYFHDNDGAWDGNLAWSPYNTDQAWNNPQEWSYSWIGDTTYVSSIEQDFEPAVVNSYELKQNYPNPFNPVTTIEYSLKKASQVEISVFNVLGQKVMTLVEENQNAGKHTLRFDATELSSGVYFYRIDAGKFNSVRKMILMK